MMEDEIMLACKKYGLGKKAYKAAKAQAEEVVRLLKRQQEIHAVYITKFDGKLRLDGVLVLSNAVFQLVQGMIPLQLRRNKYFAV